MTKVKICGLYREEDIHAVNKAKPDYAGFILNFPKSHRNLTIETAKILIAQLDQAIQSVCVVVNQPLEVVKELNGICNVVQLHGQESNSYIEELRHSLVNMEIWKAFTIRSEVDLEEAKKSKADRILLDNGYGTGKAFDWKLLEGFEKPYMLAGGIKSHEVDKVIMRFAPYGIDVSSSVEADQKKDGTLIQEFVQSVRNAGKKE